MPEIRRDDEDQVKEDAETTDRASSSPEGEDSEAHGWKRRTEAEADDEQDVEAHKYYRR